MVGTLEEAKSFCTDDREGCDSANTVCATATTTAARPASEMAVATAEWRIFWCTSSLDYERWTKVTWDHVTIC